MAVAAETRAAGVASLLSMILTRTLTVVRVWLRASERIAPIENFVSVEPVARLEKANDLPPAPAQSDVRREIQTRIAAFQAHQHRFHREREAYFNSVLTKARSAIENGPDAPTS
jgi:hypothetical protein